MNIPDLLFYVFAALTLGFGLLVVANPFSRNPVNSAMFLVLTIVSMAGLFVLLHAFFLAAVQIVVYAGAVMVLFLFVIMLLDLKQEQRRRISRLALAGGFISVGAITVVFVTATLRTSFLKPEGRLLEAHAADIGRKLFLDYLLPFEMLSVLLLVAMVGVILLSKKDAPPAPTPAPAAIPDGPPEPHKPA
jgi:NADH-quinone oxidoreductase subunit J